MNECCHDIPFLGVYYALGAFIPQKYAIYTFTARLNFSSERTMFLGNSAFMIHL